MGQHLDHNQVQVRDGEMVQMLKKLVVLLVCLLVLCIAYDVYRWNCSLARIRSIQALRGKALPEAKAFIEANRKALRVTSVSDRSVEGRELILVKIDGVSILGVLTSLLLPAGWLTDLEISGLICLNVENGIVTSTQLLY